jgi:hypothetical protein
MAPGFTKLDNDAVLDRLPGIDGSTFKVYAVLARRANPAGCCYPSIPSLAEDTGLKPRTVQNAIYRAEELGLIIANRRKGCVTVYRLTHATRCATTETGGASGCATPTQQDALGDATGCAGVTQPVAHGTTPKNKNHEQHPRTIPMARGKAAAGVEVPKELDSEEFKEAWARWTDHRKELRKPITPSSAAAQFKKLASWGVARAIAAIDRSIEAGWQGIFEDNQTGRATNNYANGPGQRYDPAHKSTVPIVGGF